MLYEYIKHKSSNSSKRLPGNRLEMKSVKFWMDNYLTIL